jgi:hypothetical protein
MRDGAQLCKGGQVVAVAHWTPSSSRWRDYLDTALNRAGYGQDRAEAKAAAKAAKATNAAVALTRNDQKTRRVAAHAAAVARAAGDYAPGQPTIDQILAPHSAPRTWHRVLVTPEMAARIQERNRPTPQSPKPNRPFRRGDQIRFEKILRGDRWRYTHQGVALDWDGRLQDGQHRLAAIARAGIAAEMMISVGMDPANYAVLDSGRPRTPAQILGMTGGASTAVKILYLHQVWRSEVLRHVTERVEADIVVEAADALNSEAFADAQTATDRLRKTIKTSPGGLIAAFYLLLDTVTTEDANGVIGTDPQVNQFIDQTITGVGAGLASERAPVAVLRRNLIRQATGASAKLPPAQLMALIVKGWNLYAVGGTSDTLVVRKGSPMPDVVIPLGPGATPLAKATRIRVAARKLSPQPTPAAVPAVAVPAVSPNGNGNGAVPRNLLADLGRVIVTADGPKIWSSTVLERLVELDSAAYGDWNVAALTAALKPYKVSTGQTYGVSADGRKANRTGFAVADVRDALVSG